MTYRGWLLAFAIVATIGRPVEVRCDEALAKIKNIVVIYAENRSFDHLYGFFPGANGIDNATDEQRTQLDHDGKPLPHLVIFGGDGRPVPHIAERAVPDRRPAGERSSGCDPAESHPRLLS
jgi:phospholipase C